VEPTCVLLLFEPSSIIEISKEGNLEAFRQAFFMWTVALGKVLTAENLRKLEYFDY
jgi:hypothetical protein